MTRLVHLSDLHFGYERAELLRPLHEALREAGPDLVLVSGDLAHRARRGQFRRAMAFLRGLDLPFVAVPGNHDVPLINLVARALFPFAGYRREVGRDLTPSRAVGRVRILSANTADPARWRRGILRAGDLSRILAVLRDAPQDTVNILLCHHPFREPPGFERGETQGAAAALPELAGAGLHLILSGHLHHWAIGLGIAPGTPQPVFQMQVGTALCAREGERDHGFAVLDIAEGSLSVTPWFVDEATLRYRPAPARRFARGAGGWEALAPEEPAEIAGSA